MLKNEGKMGADRIKVSIRYLGEVRLLLGVEQEVIELQEGATLSDLLDEVSKKHVTSVDKSLSYLLSGKFSYYSNILVNGQSLGGRGPTMQIKDGDTIVFIPILSGG